MNPNPPTSADRLQHQIDLLIDGELSLAEQRALLSEIESQPQLWRRVALGFLENQAWRQELPHALHEAPVPSAAVTPAETTPARAWSGGLWNLALAASLCLAFGVGWLANQPPPSNIGPAESGLNGPELAGANSPPAASYDSPYTTYKPTGVARVAFDRNGQTEHLNVPVYQGDEATARAWLAQLPPALDPRLKAALEARGQRVQHQTGFAPITLDNGLQGVIPVDAYRITPVKAPSY